MTGLPLFPVTTVGSWPRPLELLRAQRQKQRGQIKEQEFAALADAAVLEALRLQEAVGVDVVTDGEQRRDNFVSFVAEKLDGVRLMTLAEMLEIVEDKAAFEQTLQGLDVPSYLISNATCVGKVLRREPLAVTDLKFLKAHTNKQVKVTLPGPYILTRSLFVPALSSGAYATKEELGADVVALLRDEIRELIEAGADFIQLDEPVLTELVFSQGKVRTFMCAALAARKDPGEELELAVALINRVVGGFDGVRFGLHICRGNWSKDESRLLRGNYYPLINYLERVKVQQLVLEYATERAGGVFRFQGKELGFGVVNPRSARVESEAEIRRAVEEALSLYQPEQIWLNPDCGFATFSSVPVNDSAVAVQKLKRIVNVARELRAGYIET